MLSLSHQVAALASAVAQKAAERSAPKRATRRRGETFAELNRRRAANHRRNAATILRLMREFKNVETPRQVVNATDLAYREVRSALEYAVRIGLVEKLARGRYRPAREEAQ